MLMDEAADAVCRNDAEAVNAYVDALAERPGDDQWRVDVDRALLASACQHVGEAWVRGWQPADVARLALRRLGPAHARLVVDLMTMQMRQYAAATVDERWAAQLDRLNATQWWESDDSLAQCWERREGLDRADVLRRVLEVRHLLGCTAGRIECLCPLPGQARRGSIQRDATASPAVNRRVLDRVRALLAKAESTEFGEEAEALTAKAQELMARHSIDYALLAARTGGGAEPGGVRVGIDNPYEAAKALLLQKVAEANRCHAVWSKEPGFTTVVGYPADLEAVELLYTSLLVQATSAMVQAGRRRDAYGRSRTRSFRQSFLDAFAIRIGERLRAATENASRQAALDEGADALLPVLAARDDTVRATMEKMFPRMRSNAVRVSNPEGWVCGRAAADLATLHARRAVGDET